MWKSIWKPFLVYTFLFLTLVGCSSFQAKRVGEEESDERALGITDKWLSKDTQIVISKLLKRMNKHKGFQRYLRNLGKTPVVFIGEVQNLTSDAYFPISDLNDEFLNKISETGEFILVDAAARKTILDEITYQNDGMVDPSTAKLVGKQTGADLIIFGNVYMKPESRDGKTIKQYSINLRMTDIERGVEVFRARAKVSKFSTQSKLGW
tara:strand:- start:1663 stop:2286 length:624 start_codon:yes stop_codon:yes gene_type:complete